MPIITYEKEMSEIYLNYFMLRRTNHKCEENSNCYVADIMFRDRSWNTSTQGEAGHYARRFAKKAQCSFHLPIKVPSFDWQFQGLKIFLADEG